MEIKLQAEGFKRVAKSNILLIDTVAEAPGLLLSYLFIDR